MTKFVSPQARFYLAGFGAAFAINAAFCGFFGAFLNKFLPQLHWTALGITESLMVLPVLTTLSVYAMPYRVPATMLLGTCVFMGLWSMGLIDPKLDVLIAVPGAAMLAYCYVEIFMNVAVQFCDVRIPRFYRGSSSICLSILLDSLSDLVPAAVIAGGAFATTVLLTQAATTSGSSTIVMNEGFGWLLFLCLGALMIRSSVVCKTVFFGAYAAVIAAAFFLAPKGTYLVVSQLGGTLVWAAVALGLCVSLMGQLSTAMD